ncbi:MAG: DUF4364 family protein [Oscillospiraceae bacterium]|nr:DUF4364 family protein [Oscillospiraceae bacterium]
MEKRYGFIHEKIDIKILVLFILDKLSAPVDLNMLSEIMASCDDGISYFDFTDSMSELAETGHIESGDRGYAITEQGRKISKITESGIPYSVRVKAEKSAARASEALRRDSMIKTSHTLKTRGGNIVSLSMSDGVSDIINIEILSAGEDQSLRMEENFRKSAEVMYLKIAQMLTDGIE